MTDEQDHTENFVRVQGINTFYQRAGSSSSTVVLLHGGGIDQGDFTWREAIGPLARQFDVVVPDLPGYGATDTPDMTYTVDFYGDFLRDLLAELDVSHAHFVGLSLGGGIALNVALRYPGLVDRLVLVGSYGLSPEIKSPLLTWLVTRFPKAHRWMYRQTGKDPERIEKQMAAAVPGITSEMAHEIHAMYQRPKAGLAFRSLNRHDVTPRGLRTDYSDRVAEITAPTLLAHGEHDPLVPIERGERAAATMPNARVRAIAEAGHMPPRERPQAFNSMVLEFLSAGDADLI